MEHRAAKKKLHRRPHQSSRWLAPFLSTSLKSERSSRPSSVVNVPLCFLTIVVISDPCFSYSAVRSTAGTRFLHIRVPIRRQSTRHSSEKVIQSQSNDTKWPKSKMSYISCQCSSDKQLNRYYRYCKVLLSCARSIFIFIYS